jgi:hypothetical protein
MEAQAGVADLMGDLVSEFFISQPGVIMLIST